MLIATMLVNVVLVLNGLFPLTVRVATFDFLGDLSGLQAGQCANWEALWPGIPRPDYCRAP